MLPALTPEELQALLSQPRPGREATAPPRRRVHRGVPSRPYDLREVWSLSPQQQTTLHRWGEEFASVLEAHLLRSLRLGGEVRLVSEGLSSLGALLQQAAGRIWVAPWRGQGRWEGEHYWLLEPTLMVPLVERLLGSPEPSSPERPLGRLERGVALQCLRGWGERWQQVTGERGPASLRRLFLAPEEGDSLEEKLQVYTFAYSVRMGPLQGRLWLGLRADLLRQEERTEPQGDPSPPPPSLARHLRLPLRVVVANGSLSLKELQRLREEDVILLQGFRGQPVRLVWRDKTLLRARLGTRGGRMAVQILSGGEKDGANP